MLLSKSPSWFRSWFVFGCTFQNTVALPLVLIQTICTQLTFEVRIPGQNYTIPLTTVECIAKSQTYIFLYIFLNSLVFWIIAYDVMPVKTPPTDDFPPPLEDELIVPSTRPIFFRQGSFLSYVGEQVPFRLPKGEKICNSLSHVRKLLLRPPIIAQLIATCVALIPTFQSFFFSPLSFISPLVVVIKIFSDASTAVTNLSMSSSLGLQLFELTHWKHVFGGGLGSHDLSIRTTWMFIITRMFLIPGVLFTLIYCSTLLGLIPQDRMLLITSYMLSATPSANMCVVVPQILGNKPASGAMGLLVLGQYLLAMPSLLLWLSLAFYVTDGMI
jgi:hypothetical protein